MSAPAADLAATRAPSSVIPEVVRQYGANLVLWLFRPAVVNAQAELAGKSYVVFTKEFPYVRSDLLWVDVEANQLVGFRDCQ